MNVTPQTAANDAPRRRIRPWIEVRDRLAIVAAFEGYAMRRVGLPPIVVYLVAAALGVVLGGVRVGPAVANLWDPFYTYLFTESMPLLVIAMAAGLMGRTVGLTFFIPFVIVDMLVFQFLGAGGGQTVPHSPGAYLGRVLAFVLLALLTFAFPAVARMFYAVTRRRGFPWTLLGATLGAAAFGLLVLSWTIAVPYLVRPVFNNDFMPPLSISGLQYFGEIHALIGAGLALVAGLVLQPRSSAILDGAALAPWGRWIDQLGLLRWPVAAVGVLFFFMGLITTWLDVAVLVVGVAIGPLLAPVLARTAPFRWLFRHVPLLLRLLAGVAAAGLLGAVVRRLYFEPAFNSEFFPFVLTVALGIPIVRWLVGPNGTPPDGAPKPPAERAAGAATTVATIAVLLMLGMVIFASPVYADNCSGRVDCAVGKLSEWAAAALAFMAALLAGLWTGLKNAVINPLIPEGLASEEAVEAIRGGVNRTKATIANAASISDPEEAYRIRSLSPADFLKEAATGKWDDIIGAGGGGSAGGGFGVSGRSGCLALGTMIATPSGSAAVETLRAGDHVWTLTSAGEQVVARVLLVGSERVGSGHVLIEIALSDGRTALASARHPLSDGRLLGDVEPGEAVDGATVLSKRAVAYAGVETFDLLPAGETRSYLVGGIPLGSTIQPPTTVTSRGNEVSRSSQHAAASNTTWSSMRTPVWPWR